MRRAVAAALLLVLAGCVESDPSVVDVAPPSPPTTAAATATPPPSGAPSAEAAPPPPSGASGAAPTTAAPAMAGGTSLDGPVGSAAPHLLRADGATSLVLQVLSQEGAEPRQATLDRLTEELAAASGKPVRAVGGASPPSRAVWSGDDLVAAADASRFPVADGSAVVRILFLNGSSEEGSGVVGIAVAADVAAVFSERVEEAATGLTSPAAVERAVAVHELGHLLGLVDLVRDTGRDDPEHPGHSTNPRSVMYWAVESTLVADLLGGGPPQQFDQQDRADLAAIRG